MNMETTKERSCMTCKHEFTNPLEQPCLKCGLITFDKWEHKWKTVGGDDGEAAE